MLAYSLRDRLAAMSSFELVLWIGLVTLTIALLVLMSTRLGQARPVSKCVALSVFAHILFLAYAYGTQLRFESVGLGWEPTVAVYLADPGEEDDPDGAPVGNFSEAIADLPPARASVDRTQDPPAADPIDESVPELPMETPVEIAPPFLTDSSPPSAAPPALLPDPDLVDPSEMTAEPVVIERVATAKPEAMTEPEQPKPAEPLSPHAPEVATTPKPEQRDSMPGATGQAAASEESRSLETSAATSGVAEDLVAAAAAGSAKPRTTRRRLDNQPLPEAYSLRTADNRLQLAIPFGATADSEAAVQAALVWLASTQSEDGNWHASDFGAGRETRTLGQDRQEAGMTADTGITGLALLAFLGTGHTHVEGEYRETVQRGLEFLLRSQAPDGHLAGPARVFEKMYCHGIATLALGEAWALTADPRIRPALQQAIHYSISAQHPTYGGWRYQPGDRGDVSQFGWQLMALRSAELGGLPIDARTRALMHKFLESATTGRSRGLAAYRPGERPTRTMTAEALACRFFLGVPPSSAAAQEATDFVLQEFPGQGQSNLYYWYYATLALYQNQGSAWKTWNEALQPNLIARQRRDGRAAGSWDTDDVWGGYGGRVFTTAMAALCLEVYYRYLPLYQQTEDATWQAGRSSESVRR